MQKIDGPKIQLNCPRVLLDRVDKIAKHVGITRSETMRIMLETSCEGFEPLMKVGLLRKMIAKKSELKQRMISGLQPSLL